MSNVIAAPKTDAAEPSRWLRVYLIVIAALNALGGLRDVALLFTGDPDVPGNGWGGWAVTSQLALTTPFAMIAIFFLVKRDLRRAIPFIAGIGLLEWISYLPSIVNHPANFPGTGIIGALLFAKMMIFPLLMLMAIVLACKNQRLVLAGVIASLPSIANWLMVVAFGVSVAIYGF